MKQVDAPYAQEVVGRKGSIFYRTHSYHTKVPPEGIVPILEHYTEPGDSVLDPFCGSGMTGVASLLTGRHAVLSDLSPAAVHIASGNTATTDPAVVAEAATAMLKALAGLEEELYGTTCQRCDGAARIEYTVWSDTVTCPACNNESRFWDAARQADGSLSKTLHCPICDASFRKRDRPVGAPLPVLVNVACVRCKTREERPLSTREAELALLPRRAGIQDWYPTAPLETWREMWRGQHRDLGINTAADFFTDRNLEALAAAWRVANESTARTSMRFAVTAIINRASRRYQWNPKRPTNVLSGTLYIASLTYEFNVFSLLRRKLAAVRQLAQALHTAPGQVTVQQSSATELRHVADGSIDYVFTDPPFGANIYYSDASFLWEAWLDDFTQTAQEAIVSTSLSVNHGRKSLDDYEQLMAESFSEIKRVMRPAAWASVMFHNSDDTVWSSLERAIESAGLELQATIAFDKSQPSFKGIKQITNQERVSSFDLVLHLRRTTAAPRRRANPTIDTAVVVNRITELLETATPRQRTTPYIHSHVMRLLLEQGWAVTGFSYGAVEELLHQHFTNTTTGWIAAAQPQPVLEGAL